METSLEYSGEVSQKANGMKKSLKILINTTLCFLFLFSVIPFLEAQIGSSIEFSAGLAYSKPKSIVENNTFNNELGWKTSVQSLWSVNKVWQIGGGIMLNKLAYSEKVKNITFPEDIVFGTTTTIERTLSFYELGGIGTVRRNLPKRLKNLSPTAGLSISRLLGKSSSSTKNISGENISLDNFDVPNYSVNLMAGMHWEIPVGKHNRIGIMPIYSYSLTKVESRTIFPTNSIRTNSLSLIVSFKHSYKK